MTVNYREPWGWAKTGVAVLLAVLLGAVLTVLSFGWCPS